jgi:hypothetical protein
MYLPIQALRRCERRPAVTAALMRGELVDGAGLRQTDEGIHSGIHDSEPQDSESPGLKLYRLGLQV